MLDIKAIIVKAGITQSEFSRLIGKTRQQVYSWVSGTIQPSPMMEKHIISVCKRKHIEIIKK